MLSGRECWRSRLETRLVLVVVGFMSALRGWSYLGPSPETTPTQLALVDQFVPLPVYSMAWIIVGLVAVLAAFTPRLFAGDAAYSALVGLNGLWALSFFWSWWVDDVSRAWVSALNYVLVALLVYREATRPEPVEVPRVP
ncbi:hypothetical protein CH289_07600 [Rhodococcus sp. RS1C4]|nr:hypothetical protein CH289_07600 [Rhodococcus sp. RS1C4]